MSRRRARELALRILYWHEQSQEELPYIIGKVLDSSKYSKEDRKFSQRLAQTTIDNLAPIDRAIAKVLKNWHYDRISLIDKLLLRMGACEIFYLTDIPYEVAINEAIEISKKYSDEDSPKFINGILDTLKCSSNREKTK